MTAALEGDGGTRECPKATPETLLMDKRCRPEPLLELEVVLVITDELDLQLVARAVPITATGMPNRMTAFGELSDCPKPKPLKVRLIAPVVGRGKIAEVIPVIRWAP